MSKYERERLEKALEDLRREVDLFHRQMRLLRRLIALLLVVLVILAILGTTHQEIVEILRIGDRIAALNATGNAHYTTVSALKAERADLIRTVSSKALFVTIRELAIAGVCSLLGLWLGAWMIRRRAKSGKR